MSAPTYLAYTICLRSVTQGSQTQAPEPPHSARQMRFLGSGGFISAAALHGINVLPLSTGARSLSTGTRALSPWALALATVGLFSTPALTLSIGFLSPPDFPSVDSSTNGSLTSAAVGVDGRGAGSSTDHNHAAALNQPAAAGRWSQVSSPSSRTQPNAACFRTQDRSRQQRSCIYVTPCAFTAFYTYAPPSPSFFNFLKGIFFFFSF